MESSCDAVMGLVVGFRRGEAARWGCVGRARDTDAAGTFSMDLRGSFSGAGGERWEGRRGIAVRIFDDGAGLGEEAAQEKLPEFHGNPKAVVLLDETTYTVGRDGQATERRRLVVKVLRPQGRKFGYAMAVTSDATSFTSRRNYIRDELFVLPKDYDGLRAFYTQFESKDQESVVLKRSPVTTATAAAVPAGN